MVILEKKDILGKVEDLKIVWDIFLFINLFIHLQLEKDMFLREGHVRHFFSEDYARECLGTEFTLEKIESGKEIFYSDESGFVKVIGKKVYASN